MTPWSQAQTWALARAWEKIHPDTQYGRHIWIKDQVEVVVEDRRMSQHPSEQAFGPLIAKIESDPSWLPGTIYGSKAGSKPQIPNLNKATLARIAMALKKSAIEPMYSNKLARNQKAATSPTTGKAISAYTMSRIFR